MSKPAISVENLGKQYKIGVGGPTDRNFREALIDAITTPFQRFRNLGEHTEGEDLFWALREVTFDVEPGEVVGIIGRNGAGKSTLLKILSRITDPTTGQAIVRGRTGSLLEVGTGFHKELTGRENIYLNGAILGMKKHEIDRAFDEIVAFSEVERFLDTPVKRYSSGMNVRLAFAVAAHLRPEILIIDEVLAVGDAAFQKKCLGKMGDVAKGGRTVLFVSHNLHAVRQLCSRAVLLDHGRVIMDDTVGPVADHYMDTFTAGTGEGSVSLDGWQGDRSCPGTARIETLRTVGSDGNVTSVYRVGDPLTLEAELGKLPRNNFTITFTIQNNDGVSVYKTRSQDCPLELIGRNGRATVRMTIPKLRIVEGRYFVDVWLGDHLNRREDRVRQALSFHVRNEGDTVKPLSSIILETGEWELVTDTDRVVP